MDTKEQGNGTAPSSAEERIFGTQVGWVTGLGRWGQLQVDFEGNRLGPLEARLAVLLDEETLRRAVELRQSAVLCFEKGDPSRPLLLGLVHEPSETPLLDELLLHPAPQEPKALSVDGKRVPLEIEGMDEVVLRCGKASLTLRRDGRVLLRGTSIQVDADVLLRLRGGKTQIN